MESHKLLRRSVVKVNAGEMVTLSVDCLSLNVIDSGLDLVESQKNTTRHKIQNEDVLTKDLRNIGEILCRNI